MPRPKRVDYPGATHHVFVRGVARSVIAVDDADFEHGLYLLERAVTRFELQCHAWSYLPNHSHLLVTTQLGNVSKAMHWIGTCTAQRFNRRHGRSGHLFQGRFGSKVVDHDKYLLELARYLPRNPVKAGLCQAPGDWPWSSYAATAGLRASPWFLDTGGFLGMLGSAGAYTAWVDDGENATMLDEDGIPHPPARVPLATLLPRFSDQAIAIAHYEHGYSKAAIARHFGVSPGQVSRRLA
jgi:putative transposase